MDVVVEPLSHHPDAVPLAAEWHFREWGHTDPGGSLAAWTAGLAGQAGADQIPGTLIALVDGSPAGVVCLVGQDMPGFGPAAGLTPWIKGLYVIPQARRSGVGSLRKVAAALNTRGVRTARGGRWQATQVGAVLARAAGAAVGG